MNTRIRSTFIDIKAAKLAIMIQRMTFISETSLFVKRKACFEKLKCNLKMKDATKGMEMLTVVRR